MTELELALANDGLTRTAAPPRSLFCPKCLVPLLADSTDAVVCSSCNRSFPVRERVPMLGKSLDYYYEEISLSAMEGFLSEARRGDFTSRFCSRDSKQPWSFLLGSHFDPTRGSWKFISGLSQSPTGRRALDFGSGWGVNALSLSAHFEEVVALELSWHRQLSLCLLAEKLGFGNIIPICGGDTPRLPFPNDYFDLVVLNGVIEWIPVGFPQDPRELQLRFLREVARITKPSGELFMASENRYAYTYWAGRPDDHTGLHFGSLLPRRLANLYAKVKNKRPYQNYTYSIRQYRQLLREAGFLFADFHGITPAHRLFTKMFPIPGGRIVDLEESRGSRVKDMLLRRPEAARLAPALAMRSSKRPLGLAFLERLSVRLNAERILSEPLESSPYKLLTSNCSVKAVYRSVSGTQRVLVKIPLSPWKRALQERAVVGQQLWRASEVVGPYVSPFLRSFDFEGQPLSAESMCGARPTREKRDGGVYEAVESILEALAEKRGIGNVLGSVVAETEEFLTVLGPGHHAAVAAVSERYSLGSVGTCFSHGDFHWDNLIVDRGRRLLRVVDWEWATAEGLPFEDLFHLSVSQVGLSDGPRVVNTLRRCVDGDWPAPRFEGMARCLIARLGFSSCLLPSLAVLYIYLRLYKNWANTSSYYLDSRFISAPARLVADQAMEWATELLA